MSTLLLIVSILLIYFLLRRLKFVSRFNHLPGSPVIFGLIGDLPTLLATFKRCGSVSSGLSEYLTAVTMFNSRKKSDEKGDPWVLWVGPQPFVVIHYPELVEQVLSSRALIRKGSSYNVLHQWLGTGLLNSWGTKWSTHRKLTTPSFHFKILESFVPVMNANAKILVQILKEEAAANDNIVKDLRKPILHCALDIICETAMGKKMNAQRDPESEYIKAIYEISEIVTARIFKPWISNDFLFSLTPEGRIYNRYLDTVKSFTVGVIEERMKEFTDANKGTHDEDLVEGIKKREPFMDTLIKEHLQRPKEFTRENIREEVDTFMFEGHDTTAWAVIWTVLLLGCHADVQNKVHEEIDALFAGKTSHDDDLTLDDLRNLPYLEAVIKESQRLYPSVPAITRRCHVDTKLGSFICPAGAEITIPIFRVHRDETHWPDCERFKPERFVTTEDNSNVSRHPYAFIPFSAGPRNCIGQKFALLEEKALIARIFQHFTVKSIDRQCDMVASVALISKSLEPIRVILTPRR